MRPVFSLFLAGLAVGCAVDASDDVREARAAKVVGTSELTPVAGDLADTPLADFLGPLRAH